ncbi:MAG TPA: PilN domain-containing protein [Vicinamibacteria bacterium]|nr:PilN domain-containing protein [Vicinamibacteria bacterium]
MTIRINLLATERKASKAPPRAAASAGPPGALQAYLMLGLFVGGAAVVCAGLWWFESSTLANLDTRIAADQKRQRDLEAIKQQVDQFQAKKATLENKVHVIEQLRLTQKSPVHMLDEISKALPDFVWLVNLDETRGQVAFKGQSNSLAAVADFMSALQRCGWFPAVDLASMQDQQSVVSFDLTGQFKDPAVAAAAAAKQATGPGPGPGRPGPGAR